MPPNELLYLINKHKIMTPRKKAVKKVEEPKIEKKVDAVVKSKLTIDDVVAFLKKNPQYLVKETYYSRYSLFLDNDYKLKK